MDNLKFNAVDKYEVAWVNGRVAIDAKDEAPGKLT